MVFHKTLYLIRMLTYPSKNKRENILSFFFHKEKKIVQNHAVFFRGHSRAASFYLHGQKIFILVKVHSLLKKDGRGLSCIVEMAVNCVFWYLKHLLSVQIGDTG